MQAAVVGEDLDGYQGPARLVRADGSEPFDTVAAGQPITEHPLPGEVVWRDDAGVTCRLWNWRQCSRTQLTPRTTTALFILDGLNHLLVPATTGELNEYASLEDKNVSPTLLDPLVGWIRQAVGIQTPAR